MLHNLRESNAPLAVVRCSRKKKETAEKSDRQNLTHPLPVLLLRYFDSFIVCSTTALPHAWVLFIYHCRFVHAVGHAVVLPNAAHPSADVSARVLDFSPNSCALLAPTQSSSNFAPSPTVYVPPAKDPQPPLEPRKDGDVGRLIRKKSVFAPNEVWAEEVVTSLEYVERPMPVFLREGPAGGHERLSGLCVDEQRLVWVKRNTLDQSLVLDVHMF